MLRGEPEICPECGGLRVAEGRDNDLGGCVTMCYKSITNEDTLLRVLAACDEAFARMRGKRGSAALMDLRRVVEETRRELG